jgi:hypothetical protein
MIKLFVILSVFICDFHIFANLEKDTAYHVWVIQPNDTTYVGMISTWWKDVHDIEVNFEKPYRIFLSTWEDALIPTGVPADINPRFAKIGPNPFNSYLVVPSPIDGKFRMYNVKGLLVFERDVAFGHNIVNTNELPSGVYFWRIWYKDHNLSGKVVKVE